MRLVKEIPHERYKIQIFHYNNKYILKIELGQFEQTFKIGDTDIFEIAEVERMVTPELLNNTLKRFVDMRQDWESAFILKNNI